MRDYGFCIPDNPYDRVFLVHDLKAFLATGAGELACDATVRAVLAAASEFDPGNLLGRSSSESDCESAGARSPVAQAAQWVAAASQLLTGGGQTSSLDDDTPPATRGSAAVPWLSCQLLYRAIGEPGTVHGCPFQVRGP